MENEEIPLLDRRVGAIEQAIRMDRRRHQENNLHMAQIRRIGWRNRPRQHQAYTDRDREIARNLRRQGLSYEQIAERIGHFCSSGTVYRWVRDGEGENFRRGHVERPPPTRFNRHRRFRHRRHARFQNFFDN